MYELRLWTVFSEYILSPHALLPLSQPQYNTCEQCRIPRATSAEFRKWAGQLCPHMHTDEEDFQRRLLSTPCGGPFCLLLGSGELVTAVFAEPNMDARISISCRHEHCCTHVEIRRSTYLGGNMTISVSIHRTLGDMQTVSDPMWLAQIEA
jgi:hypothetical protein